MRGRIAVHVSRDSDLVVLALRDRQSRAAVTFETNRRAVACLAAQLWACTREDEENHDSEAEFRGALQVKPR